VYCIVVVDIAILQYNIANYATERREYYESVKIFKSTNRIETGETQPNRTRVR